MKRFTLTAAIGLLVHVQLLAQLSPVQNPPGIQWKKICTEHFEIILPEELISEGQRVANTLEYVRDPLQKTMRVRMKKWRLVLSNRSSVSNGYVTFFPRMSEWYSTPPQNEFPGVLDWYPLLAIHEGRHMAQFDAFDRGLNRLAGIMFGDVGLGAASLWATPMWFLEGDAVAMETVLSSGGRGRQPLFDMYIRAQLLSDIRYNYYKAYLRSYRDFYPNWYHLGYHLVTHFRREYGADAWSEVMQRSSFYSFSPFAFSRSMKKVSGRNARQNYYDTIKELEILWREQVKGISETPVIQLNRRRKKVWTNYRFPQMLADGSVIALKNGYADAYTLVQLFPDGTEAQRLQISYTEKISVNGDKVTWCVNNMDPRWWNQDFSDIVTYDLQTGRRQEITSEGRYFSPALSPDGSRIAAVKFSIMRQSALVILDSKTGEELRELPNPDNDFIKTPAWSEDGSRIVFTRQKHNRRALSIIDLESCEQWDVIRAGTEDVTFPVFWNEYVLYDSPWSGIDNIYAVDMRTGQRYQLTSRKFGAFYSSVANDSTLLFCDYQVDGWNAVRAPLDTARWIPLDKVERHPVNYFEPLIAQEQGRDILDKTTIPDKTYPVENYSPLKQGINFHSWYVLPLPPNVYFGIISNDYLNTLELSAQVIHHVMEEVNSLALRASYGGIRPIIDTEFRFGERAMPYRIHEIDTTDVWSEFGMTIGLRMPIDISNGPFTTRINGAMALGVTHIKDKSRHGVDQIGDGNFMPVSYQLTFLNYRDSAYRDVRPRWGQNWTVTYRHTPFKMDYAGSIFSSNLSLYYPGLWRHHSLMISAALERHEMDNYYFQWEVMDSRGYRIEDWSYDEYFYRLSLDYQFPLLYPDLALGSIIYFKRIRSDLFYDYGVRSMNPNLRRSIGYELLFDLHLLNLVYVQFEMGIRYSYLIDEKDRCLEFIVAGYSI